MSERVPTENCSPYKIPAGFQSRPKAVIVMLPGSSMLLPIAGSAFMKAQ